MRLFKLMLVVSSFVIATTIHAQKIVIKNRDQFSVTIGTCIPLTQASEGGEATLLGNMGPGISAEGMYLTSLPKNLSAGVSVSYNYFSDWNNSTDKLYQGSSASFISFGPTLMYKTWSAVNQVKNKLNLFGRVVPGISVLNIVTTTKSSVNEGSESTPLEVNATRFFIKVGAGGYWNITNALAFTFSANYQQTQSNSNIFSDKSYAFFSADMGVALRIAKVKRYKLLK